MHRLIVILALLGWWTSSVELRARGTFSAWCPFCSAINMTFTEQIKTNDVVVIARLTALPRPITDLDAELPKAKLEVTQVLKGSRFVQPELQFETVLVGTYDVGQEFLVMGVDPPFIVWTTPMKSSPRMVQYLHDIQQLPAKGSDRLEFFQQYFEDEESALAFDAYDEFATSSYEDLIGLKDRMDRARLLDFIQNPDVPTNRRRLYFTMLGVCGQADDVVVLEKLLTSEDRNARAGLDALVACYLCLTKSEGLPLIEKHFLANDEVDFVDTLAAVSAIRFHGTEASHIPRGRLVESLRLILDRPKLADMVIPDLARWEDWSVLDRLVEMFKEAEPTNNWLRVPIVQYLMTCPKPEAKEKLEELRAIDPDSVRRASFFSDFGFGDGPVSSVPQQPTEEGQPAGLLVDGAVETQVVHPGAGEMSGANSSEPSSRVSVEQVGSLGTGPPSAGRSMATEPAPPRVARPELASRTTSVPVAEQEASGQFSVWWLVTPVVVSGLMFALLWSVINGWFERLLY
ncbi:MAG TPA: hypothetical protein PKD54_01225 [Pirellulaceae bacterium]|nr:hypothetical protein [Pirellulaceae bacterium]